MFLAILVLGVLIFLNCKGIIRLNDAAASEYDIKGIDVSHWQGEIDWETISEQGVSFVFIKATEGSAFVDEKYAYNSKMARENGLSVGAYHFFSYDSNGKIQADNFINTVKPFEGMLPPVVDLEFYGDKLKNPSEKEDVDKELKILLDSLEDYYGQKPIIYASEISYNLYLLNDYTDYEIWISNYITKPLMIDKREWTFWQHTDKGRLDGFDGEEEFIDVNVFYGSKDEYDNYLKNRTYKK